MCFGKVTVAIKAMSKVIGDRLINGYQEETEEIFIYKTMTKNVCIKQS